MGGLCAGESVLAEAYVSFYQEFASRSRVALVFAQTASHIQRNRIQPFNRQTSHNLLIMSPAIVAV